MTVGMSDRINCFTADRTFGYVKAITWLPEG